MLAIAAIVVAVVIAADGGGDNGANKEAAAGGGGPSTQPATFTKADLPNLVLPADDPPGKLNFDAGSSGPYEKEKDEKEKDLPEAEQAVLKFLSETKGEGYRNVFTAPDGHAQPYWHSQSIAAVFEHEEAAQRALERLKETPDPEAGEDIPARGLGVDGFADFDTGLGQDPQFKGSSWEGSEYTYVWRTGNLLQVFVLTLSGPGVDEAKLGTSPTPWRR